jgi:hypothetical protein
MAERRKYQRRSELERIAELEQRIAEIKAKQTEKEQKKDPVLREIPKLQRKLKKFVQFAVANDRQDIANTVMAFAAGLDRIQLAEESGARRRATSEAAP